MKFNNLVITVAIVLLVVLPGQAQQDPLAIFDPLLDQIWIAEGNWGNGSPFRQEIVVTSDLENKIVLTKSKGYTNSTLTQFGDRNFGIRQYDSISGQLKFWEFDVFGGLTTGEVIKMDRNILYQYDYGNSRVTDMWEYVNDSTYNFIVGNYKDGKWQQQYLATQFKRKSPNPISYFGKKLAGNWTSKAWDGRLDESWSMANTHEIRQQAVYTANKDATYKAQSRITVVDNTLILYSVIEDNNPKIFKATTVTADSIIFENSAYGYPNKLIYNFTPDGNYSRTISGVENGAEKNYTFDFTKVD